MHLAAVRTPLCPLDSRACVLWFLLLHRLLCFSSSEKQSMNQCFSIFWSGAIPQLTENMCKEIIVSLWPSLFSYVMFFFSLTGLNTQGSKVVVSNSWFLFKSITWSIYFKMFFMGNNSFFALVWQQVNQGSLTYSGTGLSRDVKNKAVLCKPLTLTKATYCKPHMQSKLLQTGKCHHWSPDWWLERDGFQHYRSWPATARHIYLTSKITTKII